MVFRKKVFTCQKLSLVSPIGARFELTALVSNMGIKYAFTEDELSMDESEPTSVWHGYYGAIPFRAKTLKETSPAGLIFSLLFVEPSAVLLKKIESDVLQEGIPSPWPRSLPRLTTTNKSLPSPALAVHFNNGETHFLHVRDFTLGGLLLETSAGMDPPLVGASLEMDLVTNTGDKISDVVTVVCRVGWKAPADEGLPTLQLGVKISNLTTAADKKYRDLIRSHCQSLRQISP
jgi:hypothetical protein